LRPMTKPLRHFHASKPLRSGFSFLPRLHSRQRIQFSRIAVYKERSRLSRRDSFDQLLPFLVRVYVAKEGRRAHSIDAGRYQKSGAD
jgi:hypothetical protein